MRRAAYLAAIGIDVFALKSGGESSDVSPAGDESPEVLPAGSEPSEIPPAVSEPSVAGEQRGDASHAPETLDWAGLRAAVSACTACELHRSRTQTVFGVGRQDADLLVIGEAPGADEDRQGEPFVGRAGQLLNAMLRAIGLTRDDVFIANILKCRPPNNRDPKPAEIAQCTPYLERQIALIEPRAVLAVGRIAAQHLLQSDQAIGRLRGRVLTCGIADIPVVATYHPAYLLRSPEAKAKAWQDLCLVRRVIK
jgi:uracil-DNA glycosylase family 4